MRALRPAPFHIRLPGPFNVANAIAAIAAACALDVDVEAIEEGLSSVDEVPGRMMPVQARTIGVYVDYAHTPDGMRNVLGAARALTPGRVICVFGCGGDRDALKRPLMGRAARELSDVVIVTNDNPRREDPQSIIDGILSGMRNGAGAHYEVVPDRATAIDRAVQLAAEGDVVIIAGKGHEAYQLIGEQSLPFTDAAVAARFDREARQMSALTFGGFAAACGAQWRGPVTVDAGARFVPSTDTRSLVPGDAFVALRGSSFDGNTYAAEPRSPRLQRARARPTNPSLPNSCRGAVHDRRGCESSVPGRRRGSAARTAKTASSASPAAPVRPRPNR